MKEGGKKKSEGEGGRGRNRDGELSVPITLKPYGSGRTTTALISTHNPCVHGKYIHRANQILQPDLFLNHLNLIMPIPSRKSFSIYPSPIYLYVCYKEVPSRAVQGHCQATYVFVKTSFFPRLMHQLQAGHTQHSLIHGPLTHPCSSFLPVLLVRRSALPASSYQNVFHLSKCQTALLLVALLHQPVSIRKFSIFAADVRNFPTSS